jgi:hypothetical protein
MTDITVTDVATYIARRKADGMKGWTIKGHLTVQSGIHKHATRHLGLASPSPVAVLDRVERPSSKDQEPQCVLTQSELSVLLDCIDSSYKEIFMLAMEAGARLGEVLGPARSRRVLENADARLVTAAAEDGLLLQYGAGPRLHDARRHRSRPPERRGTCASSCRAVGCTSSGYAKRRRRAAGADVPLLP